MLQQKMINFIYMYIRENNQESILAYMDYINELFFLNIGIPIGIPYFNGSQLAKMKKGIPGMSLP